MTLYSAINPYPIILSQIGGGLNGGKVYIGEPSQDPETFPKAVYWDEAGNDSAAQPLATIGGYIARAGSPAEVYIDGAYSIRVRDRFNAQVFYAQDVRSPLVLLAQPDGAALIGTRQSWSPAIARTQLAKNNDIIDLRDFAAPGIGSDYTDALLAAVAEMAGGAVQGFVLPEGDVNFESQIKFTNNFGTIRGRGRNNGRLIYQGSAADIDCFVIGKDGPTEYVEGWSLEGLYFDSATTMSSGSMVRLINFVRSNIMSLTLGDQDAAVRKMFSGVHFDGFDIVNAWGLCISAAQDVGMIAHAKVHESFPLGGLGADLIIHSGKIANNGGFGVLIGGGSGGVILSGVGVISNDGGGMKIDNSKVALPNREIITGAGTAFDANGGYGIHVNDALMATGHLNFGGAWSASNELDNVFIENAGVMGVINLNGAMLFSSQTGSGLRVTDNDPVIQTTGANFVDNALWGINNVNGSGRIEVANVGNSFENTSGFYHDGISGVTMNTPSRMEFRYSGTLNGSGAATVPHGVSGTDAPRRLLSVEAFFIDASNVANRISTVSVDGTNINLVGGTASRPYEVYAIFTRDAI